MDMTPSKQTYSVNLIVSYNKNVIVFTQGYLKSNPIINFKSVRSNSQLQNGSRSILKLLRLQNSSRQYCHKAFWDVLGAIVGSVEN